ncbi:MAG: exodeoxyribonuclease VII small subunit [Alphaproteobacteria bacterium]|nr:exodeoxyribonuclease VII small subunit [Alphaproteobacteria bacterium]
MKEIDFSKITFEDALIQLESIVRELESGRIKLDDAVEAYEKAVSLKKFCEEKLKAAQLKIEKINISPDGEISTEPLDKIEEN